VAVNQTLSFLIAFTKLRKAAISFVMSLLPCPSVRTEQLDSDWKDFYEIWYLNIFENLSKIFKFHYNLTRITGTSHEDQYTFMILSRSVLLRMKHVSDKCRENRNTLLYSITFLKNHAVHEIMWKNIVERDRPQMTTTNTHPEYVILIAFSLQQWLHKRSSMLRYTYVAWLVTYSKKTPSFFDQWGLPVLVLKTGECIVILTVLGFLWLSIPAAFVSWLLHFN